MADPFNVYSDYFFVNSNQWVTTFLFGATDVTNPEGEAARLGTVTVSSADAKIMIYLAWQQILEAERNSGVRVEVPAEVLERTGWSQAHWDAFWQRMGGLR